MTLALTVCSTMQFKSLKFQPKIEFIPYFVDYPVGEMIQILAKPFNHNCKNATIYIIHTEKWDTPERFWEYIFKVLDI